MTTSSRKGRTRASSAPSLGAAERDLRAGHLLGSTRTSPMTRRARWSRGSPALPYEQAVKRYPVQPDRHEQRQRVAWPGSKSNRSWARPHSAGRRPLADGRHLLQGARRRRHQQQHQGHGAVDGSADGRDARRARRASVLDTIHAPYVVTPDRARAAAQVPRAARHRLVRLWLAQLRLCRAPDHRPPRRHQRLSLADPVRSRRRRAASSRCGTATPGSPAASSSR